MKTSFDNRPYYGLNLGMAGPELKPVHYREETRRITRTSTPYLALQFAQFHPKQQVSRDQQ